MKSLAMAVILILSFNIEKDIESCKENIWQDRYEQHFTEEDVITLSKALWGEARGCGRDGMAKVAWCVCNRVDNNFESSVTKVITAPYQFSGYRESNPVTDECYEIAKDVLQRWVKEKYGEEVERELGPTYLFFLGNGKENIFRENY